MNEPTLMYFNLEELVTRLNLALAVSEEEIELGHYMNQCPKKNPFLYRARRREIEALGKYPLIQPHEFPLLHPFNPKGHLGYIFIETGYTETNESEGGRYETLILRIKHPLELRDGNIIPNCSVKMCQETYETESDRIRKDHIRVAGLIWVRSDLSKELPPEWFSA